MIVPHISQLTPFVLVPPLSTSDGAGEGEGCALSSICDVADATAVGAAAATGSEGDCADADVDSPAGSSACFVTAADRGKPTSCMHSSESLHKGWQLYMIHARERCVLSYSGIPHICVVCR
jgi:hypothetical protein